MEEDIEGDREQQDRIIKEDMDRRTIKLCGWLVSENIEFNFSEQVYGDEVCNLIQIKDIEVFSKEKDEKEDENKLPLNFVIRDKRLLTHIFVGKWEE